MSISINYHMGECPSICIRSRSWLYRTKTVCIPQIAAIVAPRLTFCHLFVMMRSININMILVCLFVRIHYNMDLLWWFVFGSTVCSRTPLRDSQSRRGEARLGVFGAFVSTPNACWMYETGLVCCAHMCIDPFGQWQWWIRHIHRSFHSNWLNIVTALARTVSHYCTCHNIVVTRLNGSHTTESSCESTIGLCSDSPLKRNYRNLLLLMHIKIYWSWHVRNRFQCCWRSVHAHYAYRATGAGEWKQERKYRQKPQNICMTIFFSNGISEN